MIKVGTEQARILKAKGWVVEELPNIHHLPKLTFYRTNSLGEVIEMPDLPADPTNLKHYLKKGFTLERPVVEKPDLPQDEFICETCGKAFGKKIALMGHLRSHKK